MQTNISTGRLLLNILSIEDHEFIRQLVNTKGWLEFIGDRNVHSEKEAIEYVNKILNSPNIYYWVVTIKETKTPVGIISFLKRDYLEHFDIGFAFLPEFTGNGYAYEAAKEVLSLVRTNPLYNPVLATTIPTNTSSIKLLIKLGLHFERQMAVGQQQLDIYTTS